MQVSVSRREAELEMDNKDFDERKHNYRRKKWIEDGLDPDEMEDKYVEPRWSIKVIVTNFTCDFRFKKQQKAKETERKETHRKNVEQRKKLAASNNQQPQPHSSKVVNVLVKDARFQKVDAERFTKKKIAPTSQKDRQPLPAGLKRKASNKIKATNRKKK